MVRENTPAALVEEFGKKEALHIMMEVFGYSQIIAEEILAISLGESDGDVVEIPLEGSLG